MNDLVTRDLPELESVIERGLTTFVDVGIALVEIRDRGLYTTDYATFDDYCRDRWNFKRARAYQLMDAAKIALEMSTNVDTPLPQRESQVRELTRVPTEQRAEVWQAVVEEHGPEPTAKEVRTLAQRVTEQRQQAWRPQHLPPIEIGPNEIIDVDDLADDRFRVQFSREFKHINELIQLSPDVVAVAIPAERYPGIRMAFRDMRLWMDAVEQAIRPQGIRAVN